MKFIKIVGDQITEVHSSEGVFELPEGFTEVTEELFNQLGRLPITIAKDDSGKIISMTEAPEPPEFSSIEEVDGETVSKIRELYDSNEEQKAKTLAINAILDALGSAVTVPQEYIDFRAHRQTCIDWGRSKKLEFSFMENNTNTIDGGVK